MTSNANSNAANPPRSRYFTVRFARAIGRFIFSRRIIWTIAIVASLLVLFYQYENWNGAREIAAAREQLVARIGTTDPMALLPAEVPEEDNFFANPVIRSWRVDKSQTSEGFIGAVPDGFLVSKEVIAQLAEGLERPFSQQIPCRRRCVTEAGGDAQAALLPFYSGVFRFQEELARQLNLAAQADDAATTRNLAGIMLRFGEAFSTEPGLFSNLIGHQLHETTLVALNEALGCATLTDQDYAKIQHWLVKEDDLKQMEQAFKCEALKSAQMFATMKGAALNHDLEYYHGWSVSVSWRSAPWEKLCNTAIKHGPAGWFDTSAAFAVSQHLLICGDGGPENWRSGVAATRLIGNNVLKASGIKITADFSIPNFRRTLGSSYTSSFSGFWKPAAETMVKRRCAILTCALHRHRLLHGSYPASLTELDASLLPGPQPDPARADAPMNYKLTEKGFLLWSVGMDRVDDGGDAEKDWLWRHEAEKPVLN